MKPTFALVFFFITSVAFTQNFALDDVFEEEVTSETETIAVQHDVKSNNWLTNLDEAKKIARKDGKPILLYFTGSDWCTPCVALKKDFFETTEFAQYEDKFVMVYIDRPRRTDIISPEQMAYNKEIIKKYKNTSFPTMMILDSAGRKKEDLSGYSSFNTYHDTSHHFNLVKKYASL